MTPLDNIYLDHFGDRFTVEHSHQVVVGDVEVTWNLLAQFVGERMHPVEHLPALYLISLPSERVCVWLGKMMKPIDFGLIETIDLKTFPE